MRNSDLIIIGAGPGGYDTAVYAAERGLSTVIVEKDIVRRTCLNHGCLPTTCLAHAADLLRNPLLAGAGMDNVSFAQIQSRKDAVVSQLREGIETLLSKPCITLVRANATNVDTHTIIFGNEE